MILDRASGAAAPRAARRRSVTAMSARRPDAATGFGFPLRPERAENSDGQVVDLAPSRAESSWHPACWIKGAASLARLGRRSDDGETVEGKEEEGQAQRPAARRPGRVVG